MGCNFYLCAPHLDRLKDDPDDFGLHIGKSSAGWTFGWRAHDLLGLTSRDAWEAFMRDQGDVAIIDEYGAPHTFAEFRDRAYIEHRDPHRELRSTYGHGGQTVDDRGETFSHYWFF